MKKKLIFLEFHSIYLIRELFTFIPKNKQFKLNKYNSYLIKILQLKDDFQTLNFQKKIEKYDWFYIKDYYDEFYKDFNSIIQNEKINQIFYNCLSKKKNFDLNILDDKFDLMINNTYFKQKIRINMDDIKIPKLSLIKDNKFIDKLIQILKDSFNQFSTNGEMNDIQFRLFMNSLMKKNVNNFKTNNKILFDKFINIYFNYFKNKIDYVWNYLYSLGYNNLLDNKNEIDFNNILNNIEESDKKLILNLNKISNKKIYKISLITNIDTIFLQYFNNNQMFQNIKIIDISNYNLYQMITLNIICPKIEELNLKIIEEDLKYNINELCNIFPNMNILNIYINKKFNLFDLLRKIENVRIEDLTIYIDKNDNYKIDSIIKLKRIQNLKIEGNNINILFYFFNYIEFPNLTEYIINIDLNEINNQLSISNDSDYNIINQFIINTINNKDRFCLKKFFDLPKKLKKIRYLKLNFKTFTFEFKKKEGKEYLFKFNINNKSEFKKYFSNLDLLIDENEIIKYKKIDIKGINNKTNIEEIKEEKDIQKDINLCDIYFNLNIKQYFIKSFENLRSIYCEDEINILILNKLLNNGNNQNNFNNLKYINLNIGCDISNNSSLKNIFSQLIMSEKLKSLILKLNPNLFNKKTINLLFDLIQNSKTLKIINITQNIDNPIYDLDLTKILEGFPNLLKKKYCFDEFIIGKEILVSNQYPSITYEIKKNTLNNKIKILGNENIEIKKNCKIYLNNKEVRNIDNILFEKEKYEFKVKYKEPFVNMSHMFYNCSSLTSLNLSNYNTNHIIDMSYMFANCTSLTSLNLSNFNTNNVKIMKFMFYKCTSLISINLSNFNNNNVIKMNNMFSCCSSLTSLNLTNFNTDNVINMSYMFHYCVQLTNLDLSYFKTNKVIDMSYMFYKCNSLINLDLSNFNTNNVTNMNNMFYNCFSLVNLNLSKFDLNNVYVMDDMFFNLNKNCKVISNDELKDYIYNT